ncbi:MAG: hypothetical protein Q9159_006561 [Coniocarpon cinnabarinum]
MAPPFRADQVGSLLRPKELLEARWSPGSSWNARPDASAREVEKKAIADIVKQQLKRSITPITSGEYERTIFYGSFFDAMSGFEDVYVESLNHRPGLPTARQLHDMGITGKNVCIAKQKIKYERSAYLDDWLYLRSLLPQDRWKDAKMTIPSPTWNHMQMPDGQAFSAGAYSSDAEYLSDMSAAVRREILTLYDHGLRVVQIDDPMLPSFADEEFQQFSKTNGYDLDALLDRYVKAHNEVLRDLPPDLHVGLHMCRGNFPHAAKLSSSSYEAVAVTLFKKLDYQYYCLEYDSPRAGSLAPLRHLPPNKAVVLGVVSTMTGKLEDLDELKAKVHEAARVIAEGQKRTPEEALRDCLAVSPQCGFASYEGSAGIGVDTEVMWEKLDLVKRLAASLWPVDA